VELNNYIYRCCDANEFMNTLDDNSIKLIITSPPYNIGKEYETKTSIETYLENMEPLLENMVRVLREDGSICWQVGNYIDKGEVFPLDIYYYQLFKKLGLKLRNRIIWHFGHGLHCKNRFSGRYETILWFSKTDNYTFNLDDVRIPSKYPGKRYYKGEKKGQISGNRLGKNPEDVWELTVKRLEDDWDSLIWEIPNVKSNHPEKENHPCQFPIELVERCVLALTNENDVVYDPFAGVGSTLLGALKNNRVAYGTELEEAYVTAGLDRIERLKEDRLITRPLYQEVYKPTGKEKVSQIPEEWSREK
jgi:DNA modification methylase